MQCLKDILFGGQCWYASCITMNEGASYREPLQVCLIFEIRVFGRIGFFPSLLTGTRRSSQREVSSGRLRRGGVLAIYFGRRERICYLFSRNTNINGQSTQQFRISHRRSNKKSLTDLEKARFKIRQPQGGALFALPPGFGADGSTA